MVETIRHLLGHLGDPRFSAANVITWGAPVPAFGDPSNSQVATLGLNPSNREFVDGAGNELTSTERRFHTLNSLGLPTWLDARRIELKKIDDTCKNYFHRNPYNHWFKELDTLIAGTGASYYDRHSPACHLDLIPFATSKKWSDLSVAQKLFLIRESRNALAQLLVDSPIELLILNGMTVINTISEATSIDFKVRRMPSWTLPRMSGVGVNGYAFRGVIREISGIPLGKDVYLLGFNHNIQSSYGVTTAVKGAIRDWIMKATLDLRS